MTHRTVAWALLACSIATPAAAQLPVVPGAPGFGMDTPAGRGGEVHRVTTLAESGAGSLRACIEATGPRICIFEVAGTIVLTRDLVVRQPFLTLAGQTAPSPGIDLRGATLVIATHDVLVQHVRVRVGDDPDGPIGTNRDAIAIANGREALHHVVIDHVSMSWSVDEMLSIWYEATDVTLRHVIAAEALDDSIHVDEGASVAEPHGFGPIFSPDAGRVAAYGNLLAHLRGRQPLSDATDLVWVNNVVYDRLQIFSHVGGRSGEPTRNSFVGNVYLEGASLAGWAEDRRPITLLETLVPGSRAHVHDNVWSMTSRADDWDLVQNESAIDETALRAASPPSWPEGLEARPSAETLDWVLATAGARPVDRDEVDARIIRQVREGTGTVINCVADDGSARCALNAGGWPTTTEVHRPLTLPDDPSGDEDGDGYTDLEEWLHGMAAEVEGALPAPTCAAQGGTCCMDATVCSRSAAASDCASCCLDACEAVVERDASRPDGGSDAGAARDGSVADGGVDRPRVGCGCRIRRGGPDHGSIVVVLVALGLLRRAARRF